MERAVIVGGVRTPFVRAFAEYLALDTIALGTANVKALLERSGVSADQVDSLFWGGVILPPGNGNIAREIALDAGLPPTVEAMTVSRACTSGLQAITSGASAIERGDAEIVIAGGSESMSNTPVAMPNSFTQKVAPVTMNRKSGVGDYLGLLFRLSPSKDLVPRSPKIAERSTGELMGEAAERMAEIHGISREAQDHLAARSHHLAAKAWDDGLLDDEVAPLEGVEKDTILRPDTTVEKLGKLRPAFKEGGTLTAGNSTPLTDGSAAVIMMSESKAKELGLTPLAVVSQWSYVGVDPSDELLIGPAIAMPRAMARAGIGLDDVDLFDIHEAFAGQTLSVLDALEDPSWGKEQLGLDGAFGHIPEEKLNVRGGSLAFGHPFAATGPRMVTTMARELHRSGGKHAVLGICAAGGLAGAVVLSKP